MFMKQNLMNPALLFALLLMLLTACNKEQLPIPIGKPVPGNPVPGKPTNPAPPQNPAPPALLQVRIKAAIQVGTLLYDSIPATLSMELWDSTGQSTQKQLALQPGTNTLSLPANTAKVYFKMEQWKVQSEQTLGRDQLDTLQVLVLGGQKAAKQLVSEAQYIFAAGEYRPQGKTEYQYNSNGSLHEVRFYQKKISEAELRHHLTDRFFYTSGKLTEIKRSDIANNRPVGTTLFSYNGAGRIATMDNTSYDNATKATVAYYGNDISIYHQYNNGFNLSYEMHFLNGNKVAETARSSRGGGEGGTFTYDHNINPKAHLNYPNLFLTNLSQNNTLGRNKTYSGAYPSSEPYKYEYTYDADGYPTTLLLHYKTGINGENLYHTKTVFTYAGN
jgi:hypothetical protein